MQWPKNCEFLCILQWDEALYQKALSWVNEERRVAIVSEEKRESADPRVKIYVAETPLQWPKLAREIAWWAVMKKLKVVGAGPLKAEIERCHLAADLILSEAADGWLLPMKNARMNERPYRRGMALKGAFAGVPAIIVGAGPSLEKNGHLLKEFEKRALIFAGGSALNIIDTAPHFAGALDAQNPLKGHRFPKVPFCYQSRMHPANFSLIEGEKLLFPDSSCEALNWIHGEEPFQSGWTVGNFLTAVAVHFGCSPIYFVGMDFCPKNGRKYAQMEEEGTVQRDWRMAAEWTEEMAKGREFINATEGGILRLPKMKLSEVRCPQETDLRKRVQEAIAKLPLVSAEKRWKEWKKRDEVVYQKLLLPLWEIWRPVFEREGGHLELHQRLFFERVLGEHAEEILL